MFTPKRHLPLCQGYQRPLRPMLCSLLHVAPLFTQERGKRWRFLRDLRLLRSQQGLLNENNDSRGKNVDDWRRFREVGLLDEAALDMRDREAFLGRIQRLERE